jgi:hypothetical protein
MQSRQFWIGAVCVSVTVAAVAATTLFRPINLHHGVSPAAGGAPLRAFGGHDWKVGKISGHLDSALAHIAARAPALHAATAVAELRSLNPAARFRKSSVGATPEVLIDAATRGDPQQLKAALEGLGLEHASVFANAVGGWLPVTSIAAAAADANVAFMHASLPHKRAAVALQGDYVQHSYALRQTYPTLTGAGVTVGVLSDSFDCYSVYAANPGTVPVSGDNGYASNGFTVDAADDEAGGALPATVDVLAEPHNSNGGPGSTGGGSGNCLDYNAPDQLPFSDEGRAMLQIVHAVAPGASLAFYTGDDSEADFANGILKLASPVSSGGAGAQVIADDLGYYDEPFYQDGIVAQAIDSVEAAGVAYFSAAGNNANASWESTSPSFATLQPSNASNNAGEYLLNFDTTGATTATALPITINALVPGEYVAIVVEWDQPYVTGAPASGGAQNQIDLCVTGAPNTATFIVQDYANANTNCTGLNAIGSDPVQVIILGNSAAATADTAQLTLNVVVGTNSLTNAPGRLIVSVETDGQTDPAPISQYATNSETIQGHPNAAGAAAVAAAFYFDTPQCGTTPAALEPYSSLGGAPILFSAEGVRLRTPEQRQKPNFVGPDGVNDTFLGFTLASVQFTGANGLLDTTNGQCQNNPNYPNFFGTSAATPHAAGIAALFLQANSAATPTQIYSALETSALPIGNVPTTGANPTYNFNAGYGFIQADAALALLPGGPPTLTLASTAIAAGGSTTISWSSLNATSCTASGTGTGWSGPKSASGSEIVAPTTTGIFTYSLACTTNGTLSATTTVSLSVGAAPPEPTLAFSVNPVVAGATTTISWTSTYASSCTASGSWSGTLALNGSQVLTAPTTAGTDTYSIACTNVVGTSPTNSVMLTVTEAPPPAPTLTLSATSIAVGSTTTLTWSSTDATSCTASGSWSGTLATSGSQTVTPTAVGTDTYDITCSNAGGSSSAAEATLTVTAAPSSGGGGGAWTAPWLALLAGIGVVARRRRNSRTDSDRAKY